MVTGEFSYLMHFGFSDIARVNSGQTSTFIMHFEHDRRGLFASHLKKPFEDMNNEFHRCEIVVQKQYLI